MAPGGERGPLSQAHGQVCLGCALPQDTPSSCRPLIPPPPPRDLWELGVRRGPEPRTPLQPGPPHPAGAWQAAGRVSSQLKHRACSCPFFLASPQGPRTLSVSGRGTKGKRIWHRPSLRHLAPGPHLSARSAPGVWLAGRRLLQVRGLSSLPRPRLGLRPPAWPLSFLE